MMGVLFIVGVVTLIYYLAIKPYNYWTKKNVRTGKITPIFGDNLPLLLGRESMAQNVQRIYNKLADVRYIGSYQFQTPILVLKSPELIKQICVKDSDYFLNRRNLVPEGAEDLWTKNLFGLKGQAWKNMRATVSPSFTVSKVRSISALICQNANIFVQHFLKQKESIVEYDFKDVYTRYTNDIIASAAFGIQVNSLEERENEFYLMGCEVIDFSTIWRKMIFFFYLLLPRIAGFFRVSIFGEKLRSFFINLVKDSIRIRGERNIKRPDMLGLLIEAKQGQRLEATVEKEIEESYFAATQEQIEVKNWKQELTDDDIAANVFAFFIAALEVASTTMCCMAHELATHPDVQKKLIDEIDRNGNEDGSSFYETTMGMTYLDMVVTETLRKWPAAILTDRMVTKPYTIQPEWPEEKPVHLEINDTILVPIFAIHNDPQYYEDPEKFDPERFSPENRKNIAPYTYLPFGVGPRNCIGSRLALLKIKAVFFHLLKHFEIVPVEKTQIPLKLSKSALNMGFENGFNLGLRKRYR